MVRALFLLLLLGMPPVYAISPTDFYPMVRAAKSPRVEKTSVVLGDATVGILYYQGVGKTFIHLHQNETTALQAAKTVIQREGGSLITLVHGGGRNIVFHLDNTRYEFDPNRIFTDEGIKKTLRLYSQYSPKAHQAVEKLAHTLKVMLPAGKVIAVHNNAGYSLRDYLTGHELAGDAKALHVNPDNYYRNFYLLTHQEDYHRLTSQGFNGILQKHSATDDGSLSVLLAKNAYINVEAGFDQLQAQITMLRQA